MNKQKAKRASKAFERKDYTIRPRSCRCPLAEDLGPRSHNPTEQENTPLLEYHLKHSSTTGWVMTDNLCLDRTCQSKLRCTMWSQQTDSKLLGQVSILSKSERITKRPYKKPCLFQRWDKPPPFVPRNPFTLRLIGKHHTGATHNSSPSHTELHSCEIRARRLVISNTEISILVHSSEPPLVQSLCVGRNLINNFN